MSNLVSYGQMTTKDAMTRAEAAAKQALILDDSLPEAYTSLGVVEMKYHWRWREAERNFIRAIELNPDYALAHIFYSQLLVITGQQNESIFVSERGHDLDPFSPASTLNYCRAYYYARQYGRAAECLDKLNKEQPGYKNGLAARGYLYLQQGMHQQAVELFQEIYAMDKTLAGAGLGYTYGLMGRRDDALKVLTEMEEVSKQYYVPPQEFALIYLGIGDVDNAFIWLDKAAEERFFSLALLAIDPGFNKLQSDPRFINIMLRLGFPLSRLSAFRKYSAFVRTA
jgi:tetratricopeptide (TPR) repeat protein